MKVLFLFLFSTCFFIADVFSQEKESRKWKSGIELGTGLSFTGYNANLAYTGTFNKNVLFAGPKIVYSDANALFDTPWGVQLGYRRIFKISQRFDAFVSLEYQAVFFEYEALESRQLNSIQEVHLSYGLQYFFGDHWRVGNSIGGGGYIERLVDPFDGRVDVFSGYSTYVRIFCGYHF
ncbi:MAG: hypothetical protein ACI8X3_002158 [Saprospiraceae bacterium]|jgi:hypothetical protein